MSTPEGPIKGFFLYPITDTDQLDQISSFYDFVQPYRAVVDRMVDTNLSRYQLIFPGDPRFATKEDFRELMAENWVRKLLAFAELANEAGFTHSPSLLDENHDASQLNTDGYVMLTTYGSYLFVGPNAFPPRGTGAKAIYERIPFRSGEKLNNFDVSPGKLGLLFTAIPEESEMAHTNLVTTSAVLLLYRKSMLQDTAQRESTQFSTALAQMFTNINETTMGTRPVQR